MNKIARIILIVALAFSSNWNCCSINSGKDISAQNPKIRNLCKKAQELESQLSQLESDIEDFEQKEKSCSPILRSTYAILTRCFTLLFDLQRFSKFLVMNQKNEKNDFVRCAIIIKNFSSYFNSVSAQLSKNTRDIVSIKDEKIKKTKELRIKQDQYNKLKAQIKENLTAVPRTEEQNLIKNVVYHIATKSASLDELDAELESENAVGVLKNTKIRTELSLTYPANGKLVSEFGDQNYDGEMIYCLAFETRKGAIVTSPAKGLVVFSEKFLNYGNIIIISNGDFRIFLYGMSDNIFINTGDVVEIGDYIGTMSDNQTDDRNPIIKMELRKSGESLDPRHWLFQTIEKENNETNGSKQNIQESK